MKLKEFISELEKIQKKTNDINQPDVLMADFIPVVKPILSKSKKEVFITDEEQ